MSRTNQSMSDRNKHRRTKRLLKRLNLPEPPRPIRTNQRRPGPDRNERRRTKRLLKHLNSPKPSRSPNRFILYRKYMQNRIFNDPNNPIDMRNLSRIIAKMWEQEPQEVKNYWDLIAERNKINSSYGSSFDVHSGLDMSISSFSNNSVTFVNASAPPSISVVSQQNESSTTTSSTSNPSLIISDNFIFESPELDILSNISSHPFPQSLQSPQLTSDSDPLLPAPSISEHLLIDPRSINDSYFDEYSSSSSILIDKESQYYDYYNCFPFITEEGSEGSDLFYF